MHLRRLVLLHSNDLHGDFFATETHDKMVGGMSMLSGYVQKVREEEKDPVLYVISGDMLQGSIIDQEYKGISTILIMNMLAPDVVTLGNHETDYGFAHLMFLERCARFTGCRHFGQSRDRLWFCSSDVFRALCPLSYC